jgi:hypothetical protein
MKKLLSIATAIVINLTLLFGVVGNMLIWGPPSEILNKPFEMLFTPDPSDNITLVLSLVGLILYNTNLVVNRKK